MKKELMEKKLTEMKVLFAAAEKAHKISLDEKLDEDTTDAAYAEYWKNSKKIAAIIIDLIHVDEKIAMRMAIHQKDRIIDLLSRTAA
jgi:long-subunit acyl-CoA synthetase (AMP-forming)